jgi:diacylglycerol kinase (ATP)
VQKIRVFLNQNASQSTEQDWKALIRNCLFRSELEFITPPCFEQFEQEIERATRDQIDVIISVGGDGTIHSLVQKLADKNISFLVLPAGTANDLARSLGTLRMHIQDALVSVRRGKPKAIDLIDVNGQLMATNGGIGIVADCALRANELRRTVPGFRKLMSMAKEQIYGLILGSKILLEGFVYYNIRVDSDGFSGEVRTAMILVNNQPHIAATFPVAPNTKHDDGTFNVLIFLHQKPSELISAVYRIRKGIHPENDPLILSFESKRLQIESVDDKTLNFIGDGELLSSSKRFDVGIRPKALLVFAEVVEKRQRYDYSNAAERS